MVHSKLHLWEKPLIYSEERARSIAVHLSSDRAECEAKPYNGGPFWLVEVRDSEGHNLGYAGPDHRIMGPIHSEEYDRQ